MNQNTHEMKSHMKVYEICNNKIIKLSYLIPSVRNFSNGGDGKVLKETIGKYLSRTLKFIGHDPSIQWWIFVNKFFYMTYITLYNDGFMLNR